MIFTDNKTKTLTAFLLIIFYFFSAGPAFGFFRKKPKKPVSKPSPAATPSPETKSSPADAGRDVFFGVNPVPFDFDEKKIKNITIYSCGYKYQLEAYVESPENILIPLSEKATDMMLDKFGTGVKYDSASKEIVFTREKDKVMRMRIDMPVADIGGQKKEIPVPARIVRGMVHISPASFSKFIWAGFMYDDKKDIYYMDPWVLDLSLETNKRGLTKVVARGTGPFRHRILKLREPTRFVIDIMNACLDGKARQVMHPTLGPIRISQNTLKGEEGNIVRIVIPQSENIEIAMAPSRAENYVEAELRRPTEAMPLVDLAVQKIESITVDESDELVTVTMETSGPVQMEWTRLLSPDDRFFIDMPGALYPQKKKDFKLNSKFLPEVKIAQNEPLPNPKVRMTLALEQPGKVTFKSDEKNPNKVRIFISNELIDPENAQKKGFFIAYYPSKNLIVCIDPGHGGSDPGAVNRQTGLMEKTVVFDISLRVKEMLKKDGWTVVMTRNSDRDVTYPGSPDLEELGARSSIANDMKSDIFVSIHINASVNSGVKGFATYWYKETDKRLAEIVQSAIINKVNRPDLGIRRDRFYVLRHSRMPAILLELGFISNAQEAALLKTPAFRQKIAEGIVQGLKTYAHTVKSGRK